jgi:G3E family GTPase
MKERKQGNDTQAEPEEQPTLSELMIDQLEIANIIIVNKKDLIPA